MYSLLTTKPQKDYELLDSGEGEKLERYGSVILSRPDPQALWHKNTGNNEWNKAQAQFIKNGTGGKWRVKSDVPKDWIINLENLTFEVRLTPFKHTGIFPEQTPNWQWINDKIVQRQKSGNSVSILNLFGYTGGATLIASKAGAEVCHVDASKSAIAWAKKNAELSGLKDKPTRWILDDALAFVKKELRRDKKYDGIIMDPPAFGRGPKGELWKIETNFLELYDTCIKILSSNPLFFIINGYASGYSALAYENNLNMLKDKFGGESEIGELTIEESFGGRKLPAGIFGRWSK